MKKMRVLLTTLAAAAVLVLLPGSSALKANAAEAKNYAVKFVEDDKEWRFQEGTTFDESKTYREIYYLQRDLKEGDKVAVYSDVHSSSELDLGSVKLSELTICSVDWAVVRTGGVSICNVLAGSSCSITGNIDNAHVYDVSTVTFVDNVAELIATANELDFNSNIGCNGTVWHLHAYSINQPKSFYNLYNFSKGKLEISDGSLKTEYYYYDEATAVSATAAPAVTPTPAPAATSTPASSSEYDDVPKTGSDSQVIFWILGIGIASCFASVVLHKKAAK